MSTNNEPIESYVLQGAVSVDYPKMLGAMVNSKPLWTGKHSFFWLRLTIGVEVASGRKYWSILEQELYDEAPQPLFEPTPINPDANPYRAMTKEEWIALPQE